MFPHLLIRLSGLSLSSSDISACNCLLCRLFWLGRVVIGDGKFDLIPLNPVGLSAPQAHFSTVGGYPVEQVSKRA